MLSLILSALVGGLPAAVPQGQSAPAIAFKNDAFTLKSGPKTESVPLRLEPQEPPAKWPPERLLFRKDAAYAVWDSRGLAVRQKDWVYLTKLAEVPTSPRIFSREEILETKARLERGERKLEASGLSGGYRDGNHVFLLARWDERDGKPWLEALFRVDLTEPKPKPKLLGKFAGLSLDLRPGRSRLFPRDGKPAIWMRGETEWGLGIFDPGRTTFEARRVGGELETAEIVEGRIGWCIERTDHPSRIFSRWDTATLSKRELLETRGRVRLLGPGEPWIAVVNEDGGAFLHNVETGARLRLPRDPGFRQTTFGVLVWTPANRPSSARLFEPSRFDELAAWPPADTSRKPGSS
jgi:hypothetical protein